MFWRKPTPKVDIQSLVVALPDSVFHLTATPVNKQLPQGWKALFSVEDQRDITSDLGPIDGSRRLRLTYQGVLQLDVTDIRHLAPYPTTWSHINRSTTETVAELAVCLTTLTDMAQRLESVDS